MMTVLDDPEFERWRTSAARAGEAAAVQAEAGYFEWSCFLREQSAQLVVKALLHGIGAGGWGHDLAALVARAAEVIGPEWPADLAGPAERLSRFYLPTRYPDAIPGGTPAERFGAQDAADTAADAALIFDAVDRIYAALAKEAAEANGSSQP